MSLFGLFRGFFNLPERGGGEPFFEGMARDDEDEDDEDDVPCFGRRQGRFGFGPDGLPEGFTGLFQEMDELFRGMGSWEIPVRQFEYPAIGLPPFPGGSADSSRRTPRDWMLKEPGGENPERGGDTDRVPEPEGSPGVRPSQDGLGVGPLTPYRRPWNPSRTFEEMWKNLSQREVVKEDKDLDSRANAEGLDQILKPSTPDSKPFFKSVSVSKVVLPDGSVEERRVTRDGEGNEETTVTRAHGGQSHTTVTRRDAGGKEEQTEQMVNMDDRDLQRFAEKWDHREGGNILSEPGRSRDPLSLLDRLLMGIFSNR